jgi:exodeoxyribonuclease I
MAQTLYFYDLETSGFSPSEARIMQFAGQRTTLELEPIGEPDEFFVQLGGDVLPDPDSVLVTGITPQQTRSEGYTEREFAEMLTRGIATPDTIFVGYNSIRFDDEFVRNTLYRTLRDPYEWQWQDGRSRWDLLDVIRMTRALRPDGIKWPVSSTGAKVNKLELVAELNGIDQGRAHSALSDVYTTIGVAKMIHALQPKLFDYLLQTRDKTKVAAIVGSGTPFVYSSGRYKDEFDKTAVVVAIGPGQNPGTTLVYDLRIDPDEWLKSRPTAVKEDYAPIKLLKHNHCPAVAPLGVLDQGSWQRIGMSPEIVEHNLAKVRSLQKELCDAASQSSR